VTSVMYEFNHHPDIISCHHHYYHKPKEPYAYALSTLLPGEPLNTILLNLLLLRLLWETTLSTTVSQVGTYSRSPLNSSCLWRKMSNGTATA